MNTTQASSSMSSKKVKWWWRYSIDEDVEGFGEFSLEAMDDEEVSLVDGVFDGAFGALGSETAVFTISRALGSRTAVFLEDSLYFHGKNPKELQEFPPKVQNAIKVYDDLFAKGRELYLKMHSSFLIFNRERKLVVPSVTIAQLGVSNQYYPSKDVNMEHTTPILDDLALSFFRVFSGSSKIGSGPGRTDKVRINYYSKNLLIYSHFQEKINEVQIKALVDFEDHFETFSGLLAPLPEDLKQLLCGYLPRTPRYHCQYCSEGISIPMTKD
nr:hypothetical protein [Tanacetum cinerariifolium]